MNSRFDAVLFDLDGTLADTLEDIGNAVNHALEIHGLPTHPLDDYRGLVGEGVDRLVERALPADRHDLFPSVLEAVKHHYVDHILDRTTAYPGIPDLLDTLTERGVAMAVLSNKPEPATRHIVDTLFAPWSFAIIAGGRDGVPLKPDPAAALAIADGLDVAPERTLYLGDTSTDMETAVNARMFPVGALWGFRDRAELVAHGARALVTHPAEVDDLLDSLPAP